MNSNSAEKIETDEVYSVIGECGHCCKTTAITPDQHYCEDCECDMDYCRVCNESFVTDGMRQCRHIHWSAHLGNLVGCGAPEIEPEDHKEYVFAFLDETGLAKAYKAALQSRMFYLRRCGSSWAVYLDGKDYGNGFDVKNPVDFDFDYEEQPEIGLGSYWLRSLWSAKGAGITDGSNGGLEETHEYEAMTIKWIDEYLSQENILPAVDI